MDSHSIDLQSLFEEAVQLPPELRSSFLEQVIGENPEVGGELKRLLAADAVLEDSFLRPPTPLPVSPRREEIAAKAGSPHGRIGPYILVRPIGRGGMGSVYLAERAEGFAQRVAIKFLNPGPISEDVLRRFLAERQLLADLSHPYLARLLDGGTTEEGLPYLVMEYIEGEPIDRYCEGRKLPCRSRAGLLVQVCEAVQAAHRRGVIHCDLKPSNILVDAEGRPRILDFGIARRVGPDQVEITRTGQVVGTPSYMAPEQASGQRNRVGPTTDVYGLGAVLYCLLTGRPPFRGASLEQIQSQEVTAPRRWVASLPRDLETICLKCLNKDPGRRYPSVKALAEDLQRFLEGRPIQARPTGLIERSWRWTRRNPIVASLSALVILVVSAAVLVTWFALSEAKNRDVAESQTKTAEKNLHITLAALKDQMDLFRIRSFRLDDLDSQDMGNLPNLDSQLQFYRQLVSGQATDPSPKLLTGIAHDRISLILDWKGERDKALQEGKQALATLEEVRKNSSAIPVLVALAEALANQAYRLEERPNALTLFLLGLVEAFLPKIHHAGPKKEESPASRRLFQRALEMNAQAMTGEPAEMAHKLRHASILQMFSLTLRYPREDFPEAQKALDQAIRLVLEISNDTPPDLKIQTQLAQLYNSLGSLLIQNKASTDQVAIPFTKAIETLKPFVSHSNDPRVIHAWWVAHMFQAEYAFKTGLQSKVVPLVDAGVRPLERLVSLGDVVWLDRLLRLHQLGASSQDSKEALEWRDKFVWVWRRKVPTQGESLNEIEARLGSALIWRAAALESLQRLDAAARDFDEAVNLFEGLDTRRAEVPNVNYRQGLLDGYRRRAFLNKTLRRFADAARDWKKVADKVSGGHRVTAWLERALALAKDRNAFSAMRELRLARMDSSFLSRDHASLYLDVCEAVMEEVNNSYKIRQELGILLVEGLNDLINTPGLDLSSRRYLLQRLAWMQGRVGKNAEAAATYKNLVTLIDRDKDQGFRAEMLARCASELEQAKQYEEAIALIEELSKTEIEVPDPWLYSLVITCSHCAAGLNGNQERQTAAIQLGFSLLEIWTKRGKLNPELFQFIEESGNFRMIQGHPEYASWKEKAQKTLRLKGR